VLYVVGRFNIERITTFKATKTFDVGDFHLLNLC
jgi:hypothetical protein